MNEFTKDELLKIWRCVNPVIIGDAAYSLKDKLESMIDNYCDEDKELTEIKREIEALYE
jgi:hypothetical protein